jgi:polyferredoxin
MRWGAWRRLVQGGFLALALAAGLRHLWVADAPSVEASCPFGAIETAASLLTGGAFLRNLSSSNLIALGVVLASGAALGRLFCGWACPIGALQDGLAGLSRRIYGRRGAYPWRVPRWLDRPLRWLKVLVLGWLLWASVGATAPPLAAFCPYRTLFEFGFFSLFSTGVMVTLALLSMIVERFWCRYLCPLGALLTPFNRFSPWRPRVNKSACRRCGRCETICPAGIDPVNDGATHPECLRCYACADGCRVAGAVSVSARGPAPRS